MPTFPHHPDLSVALPSWSASRLQPRIVHLGCGAFHRAHQALYQHHLLEISDSDWGICEVNLMSASGQRLVEDLRQQQLLYTVAEQGAAGGELTIIGSVIDALHPALDGTDGVLRALTRPQVAIVSLTVTEKGYCVLAASGELDLSHPLIAHDLAHPATPKSAIGYLVEALRLRREQDLPAFTVLSCDNLRDNGGVARTAVLGFATQRDPALAAWIDAHVTFPCTMVDRIVPAVTDATLQQIAAQLGAEDPCAVACEPFRQWVIEDRFVNGRPDWQRVGAQFVPDVAPFELMKLRLLNGSHSFLAYLGYLAGFRTIAESVQHPAWRQAVLGLMLQEQAPTLALPAGTDLQAYAAQLLERFTNPALQHRCGQIAMDGSQKLPQRLLDAVRHHLAAGSDFHHLALGIAGWMRYVRAVDEQGEAIEVVDPLLATLQQINQRHPDGDERVEALLAISSIFGSDLPASNRFVSSIKQACRRLDQAGARAAVASLTQEPR